MKKYIFILCTAVLLLAALSFISRRKCKIEGVWKIVAVQTVKPDGTTTTIFPLESQAIFTQQNYSLCWSSHSTPIRDWLLPDSVKLSRFNQSIINAGTYELKDSVLTTRALFAMHPMFTNGLAKFTCYFANDTLILKGISVFSSENIANPVYAKGSHFITKLIKQKPAN